MRLLKRKPETPNPFPDIKKFATYHSPKQFNPMEKIHLITHTDWRNKKRFEVVRGGNVPFLYDNVLHKIVVEKGDKSNGADVPHWLRSLISALDIFIAAFLHDIGYRNPKRVFKKVDGKWVRVKVGKKGWDMLFRFFMKYYDKEEGSDRWFAWLAVKLFGRKAFNEGRGL